MPSQEELQALLDIICQGPAEQILDALQEAFPSAGWTDGELGDCVVETQAQALEALLVDKSAYRFPVSLVAHLGFQGEDVVIEDILRRSDARLDLHYREETGVSVWRFKDKSTITFTCGGWHA
jgi:hypothetical protein